MDFYTVGIIATEQQKDFGRHNHVLRFSACSVMLSKSIACVCAPYTVHSQPGAVIFIKSSLENFDAGFFGCGISFSGEGLIRYGANDMPIEMFTYLFKILKKSTQGATYNPVPYVGDIHLFKAKDTEKIVLNKLEEVTDFWEDCCIGNVDVIPIPGKHLTCITQEENITLLVDLIASNK